MIKNKNLKKNMTYNDFKKKIIKNSIYTMIFLFIMLFLGLIFQDSVSELSVIDITFFKKVCYLSIILTFILLLILFFSGKEVKEKYIKVYRFVFIIIDLFEFAVKFISFIFIVIMYFITPTTVSGISMMNTYYDNDKLLVWDFLYNPSDDDVVICDINTDNYSVSENEFFIKRIVAVEGDSISFVQEDDGDGDLYVNDSLVCEDITYKEFLTLTSNEDESVSCLSTDYSGTVASGYSIVLGDNRDYSYDSRAIGMIHDTDIIGKVFFRYYSDYGNIGIVSKNLA